MGLIDSMARRFGYVPTAELEQSKPPRRRVAPVHSIRSFEAGNVSRLTADLPATTSHINLDMRRQAAVLISRARWLQQNDDYVRRFFRLVLNNVIGANGIRLNALIPSRDGRGFDTMLNDAIESEFALWSKRGECDITGRYSLKTLQRAALRSRIREGEAIIHKRMGAGPWGLRLHLVDNLRVPHMLNDTNRQTGNRITMGVECDAGTGMPVAYYVATLERGPDTYSYHGNHYQRIPASQIIHVFDPEFAEQERGFSEMVSAMRRLPMLGGYEEAALVAARVGASKFAYWKRENSDELEEDEETDSGEAQEYIEPGIIDKPPPGYELESYDPAWPNTQHGEFVKSLLRGVASGLGVSYNSLANDLEGVNLSSIRHGTQEDREQYKGQQDDLIEQLMHPIYEAWLPAALSRGRITVRGQPKEPSPENIERMSKVAWRARRWEFPEPLKDRQAQQLDLQMKTTSPSQIIRDRGNDPLEVWSEYARDVETLAEMGLTLQLEKGQGDSGDSPDDENDEANGTANGTNQ